MVNIPSDFLQTAPTPGTWLLAPRNGRYEAKNLSLLSHEGWAVGSGRTPGAETLAASVPWVFAALRARQSMVRQIPTFWTRAGSDSGDELPPQFGFHPWIEMARIDTALELYKQAFYHKQRNMGGRAIRLRWLDPATIEPDDTTGEDGEYAQYRRTGDDGRQVMLPAGDVLRLWVPGVRELTPDATAAQASSVAAQISKNVSRTLDTFFETNGLPAFIVSVPMGTSDQMKGLLRRQLERVSGRLANFGGGKSKFVTVSGDITIERLSFAPEELDTTRIDEAQRDAILSAHGVPAALIFKDVNLAEATKKHMMFANDIIGQMQFLMYLINNDPDIAQYNVALDEKHTRLEMFQQAEGEKAESIQRRVGGPIMTVNEGRALIELDPVPGGDVIYPPSSMLNTAAQASPAALPDAMETPAARSVEVEAEAATFRRWLAKEPGRDPDDFRTTHMTAEQKAAVFGQWATENRRDLHGAFAEAMKRFEEALTDDA